MKILIPELKKTDEQLPKEGQLCIVYLPLGVNTISSKTLGPSATAYYRAPPS